MEQKVLLIDDNHDFVTLTCAMLEFFGYETLAAYTGSDGLEKAAAVCPDVIISDIGLPDIDGYKVAQILRRNAATKNCFLISLSGYVQPSDFEASKDAGFDMHIGKPVDMNHLQRILETLKNRQQVMS